MAQSLRPFPEYSVSLAPQFANQGDSFYDSLQVKFIKRLSHGLDVSSNYTFSKTENIGGYINADPSNRTIQKGLDSQRLSAHLGLGDHLPDAEGHDQQIGSRQLTGDWTWSAHPALCERRPDCRASIAGQQDGAPTRSRPEPPWCGFPACRCT